MRLLNTVLPTAGRSIASHSLCLLLLLVAVRPAVAAPADFPDYAPVGGVVTDDGLVDLAPELQVLLDRLLGERHLVVAFDAEDGGTVWARDFQPIYRLAARGVEVVGYESKNINRRYFSGLAWGQRLRRRAERLSLLHENGNLVLTERFAFVTERLLEDNEGPREAVLAQFAEALGRQASDVMVVPSLPDEATQHVDLWILALGPNQVMVPKIEREALAVVSPSDLSRARKAALMLDTWAERLVRAGLRVDRLPMLAPFTVQPVVGDAFTEAGDVLYLSPANALLLNLGQSRHVVLPHINVETLASGQRKAARLQGQYERRWARFFRKNGWLPESFEGTHLVHHLGLARCVTAPFPVPQRAAL